MTRHLFLSAFISAAVYGALHVGAVSADEEQHKHEHPHAIPEVLVTADPLGRADGHFSAPVSVLDADALRAESMRNLGETVAEMPGVTTSDFGAAIGRPVIRGLGGGRVRILENGIGSMDVSTISGDHAVSSEPIFAEQIEILRGPATLLYGSGASGGLVNVVTNRIPTAPLAAPTAEVYSHFDTASEGWLSAARGATGLGDSVTISAEGLWRSTSDVDIPGFAEAFPEEGEQPGILSNSNSESSSFGGGASWVGERGHLGFHISHLDNEYGVPGAHGHHEEEEDHDDDDEDHEEEEEEGGVRVDVEQTRYDFSGSYLVELPLLHEIRGRWGFNDYEHAELEGPGEIGTLFNNEEFEGRFEFLLEPLGAFDTALGVQVRDREFEAVGEEAYVAPAEVTTVAVFGFGKAEFGDVHIDTGLRYEHHDSDSTTGAGNSNNLLSVSFGSVFEHRPGYEVGLSASRTQRAPRIEELYAEGAHLATNTFEIGDANLGEETSHNIDVFWRKTSGRLRFDVGFFYNAIDDFIYLANNDRNGDGVADRVEEDFLETGEIVDEDEALLLVNQRQQDAEFWGFELAADWTVFNDARGMLTWRVWSDQVNGELSDGSEIPRLPPTRIGTGLRFDRGPWDLRWGLTHALEKDDLAPLETVTDSYTLIRLYAGYTWEFASGAAVTAFARGTNLTDDEGRRHTSFVKDLAPLAGTSAMLGVRASF